MKKHKQIDFEERRKDTEEIFQKRLEQISGIDLRADPLYYLWQDASRGPMEIWSAVEHRIEAYEET